MKHLKRGELAKQAGVNSATIRYYEKIGLLKPPLRSNAGYRLFSDESIARIRFIKRAQELGFSLREINELLNLKVTPDAKTTDVRKRATEKIADIGTKIRSLHEMKRSLELMVESCCTEGTVSECPILENLSSEKNL